MDEFFNNLAQAVLPRSGGPFDHETTKEMTQSLFDALICYDFVTDPAVLTDDCTQNAPIHRALREGMFEVFGDPARHPTDHRGDSITLPPQVSQSKVQRSVEMYLEEDGGYERLLRKISAWQNAAQRVLSSINAAHTGLRFQTNARNMVTTMYKTLVDLSASEDATRDHDSPEARDWRARLTRATRVDVRRASVERDWSWLGTVINAWVELKELRQEFDQLPRVAASLATHALLAPALSARTMSRYNI